MSNYISTKIGKSFSLYFQKKVQNLLLLWMKNLWKYMYNFVGKNGL